MKSIAFALAAAALSAAGSASAATITPVSVTASSTFNSFYSADYLIDGSGLSADGLHDNNFRNMWMAGETGGPAQLTFDLGATYTLAGADIWNFGYATDPIYYEGRPNNVRRGVKAFRILTSLDGIDFTEVFDGTLDIAATVGQPVGPVAAQSIAFDGTARFVKFDILSNYFTGDDPVLGWPSERSGLSEVRFTSATAAVPEPGTWAMMIGGLGLVGATLRRRQGKLALA